ncbi:MAG: low molecular weight protein-tyrosine-phosphatase [Spirochaetota bacterium]
MTRIMFVCTGNICRSPMAHGVFLHRSRERGMEHLFDVESSGTTAYHVGEPMDRRAASELSRHGIRFENHAKGFRARDAAAFDLILAMDQSNYRALVRMLDDQTAPRVRMFRSFDPEGSELAEVPDPWYGGTEGFAEVYTTINRTVGAILDRYAQSDRN